MNNKSTDRKPLSAQELYQIAKKNELLNKLRKERAEEAALEAFNHLAYAMLQWKNEDISSSDDNDMPLTETIILPEALREPIKRNAFGMPLKPLN